MKKLPFLLVGLLVVACFFSLAFFSFSNKQIPFSFFSSPALSSPHDWIKEKQIKVYSDKVVLELSDASWASFTDTHSMEPFINADSNALEIKPQKPEQIGLGDVISYQTQYGIIIHRVVEKGVDEQGIYYIVKGDNNQFKDPMKVRFDDIVGVVVAVVY